MNGGLINCECGKQFYCETVRSFVHCIQCDKEHALYPLIIAQVEESNFSEEGE